MDGENDEEQEYEDALSTATSKKYGYIQRRL